MTQTIAEAWMDEARIQTLRDAVLRVLRSRFPDVTEEVQQRISSLSDAQRLEDLLNRVALVEKPEDLGL